LRLAGAQVAGVANRLYLGGMSKRTPKKTTATWTVFKHAKKVTHLGHVTASDEKDAVARAILELKLAETDKGRLVVRPFH
jgi:hypothetical protein